MAKNFDYSITLEKIRNEDGGGWCASVPRLEGCVTGGESLEEAIEAVQDVVETYVEMMLEDNESLPIPDYYEDKYYSGNIRLRVPASLHEELVKEAKKEGVSLNQYMVYLLTKRNSSQITQRTITNLIASMRDSLNKAYELGSYATIRKQWANIKPAAWNKTERRLYS